MKKIWILMIAVICACVLAGCSCEHVWEEATCLTPKTCTECGVTEGNSLGHEWSPADCENPMRCIRCDFPAGDPLGHDWREASCETAAVCLRCQKVDGDPLGHDWASATCDTPETCTRCAITRGDPAEHTFSDWVLSVETAKRACTACGLEEAQTAEEYLLDRLPGHWRFDQATDKEGATISIDPVQPDDFTLDWHADGKAVLTNGADIIKGTMTYIGYQNADGEDFYGFNLIKEAGNPTQFVFINSETRGGLYCLSIEDTFLRFVREEIEFLFDEETDETTSETTEETVPETTEETVPETT